MEPKYVCKSYHNCISIRMHVMRLQRGYLSYINSKLNKVKFIWNALNSHIHWLITNRALFKKTTSNNGTTDELSRVSLLWSIHYFVFRYKRIEDKILRYEKTKNTASKSMFCSAALDAKIYFKYYNQSYKIEKKVDLVRSM